MRLLGRLPTDGRLHARKRSKTKESVKAKELVSIGARALPSLLRSGSNGLDEPQPTATELYSFASSTARRSLDHSIRNVVSSSAAVRSLPLTGLSKLGAAVVRRILVFLASHEEPWDKRTHWGECGQSCPCCRAINDEDYPSGCNTCRDGFVAARLSVEFSKVLAVIPRCSAKLSRVLRDPL